MKHLTGYTKSFIIILILSLGSAYAALAFSRYYGSEIPILPPVNQQEDDHDHSHEDEPERIFLNTANWQTFEHAELPLTFKYPKGWTAKKNPTSQDYDSITITTPKREKIIFYISESDYYAMKGLTTEPFSLYNIDGKAWNETIVAAKAGKYYFTFDASQNSKPIMEFLTILSTVEFLDY